MKKLACHIVWGAGIGILLTGITGANSPLCIIGWLSFLAGAAGAIVLHAREDRWPPKVDPPNEDGVKRLRDWLEDNPEAKASVMRGIEQARRGELVDVNVEDLMTRSGVISRPEICTAEECLAFDRLVVYRDKKLSPMTISEGDRDRLISMILKLRQAYDEATGKNYTTKRTDTQSPENEGVR